MAAGGKRCEGLHPNLLSNLTCFNQLVCCTKAKTEGLCAYLDQPPLCPEFLVSRGALLTNVVEYVLLSL